MRKLSTLLLVFCTSFLLATDYYVAKDGNDANDGSEGSPFLTIGKAASLMVAGDVCYIKEGTYREVINPANGGTATAAITFRAFGEDEVIVSATEPITEWEVHSGNIYKASIDIDLGRQTMLFFEGEAMDIARWPNNTDLDPYTIDAMTVDNGTAGTIVASNLPAGVNLEGAYVWYLGAHSGASWTQPINSITGNTINHNPNDINRWPFNPHNPTVFRNGNRGRFYVFGALDLLDFEGEWYFDDAANEVFFQPPGNGDLANAQVDYGARTHTALIERPYITLEGLTMIGGMLELKGANTIVRACEIRHGLQSLDEMGNTDAQVSEGAVWVRASNILIEDNLIEGGSLNGVSVQGWGGVSDITISGNEILEFNTVGNHSSPIRCRAIRSTLISNTIVGGGRDGIFIPASDCEVAWNDVSDVMRINNDGGLFYVVGNEDDKNTTIHHNWFHDSFGPEYADGRCAGIYLDNDSKGYDVHHNVVWNISWTGVQMNWDAWNNDIFNNTFWNVGGAMGTWLNGRTQVNNRIWNNYADSGQWEGQSEENNLIDAADQFRDLTVPDFRPRDNSELVNAGKFIEGITTEVSGWAPDIGAYERGLPRWVPGAPRAEGIVTSSNDIVNTQVRATMSPNPTHEVTTLSFVPNAAGPINWQLFTTEGKVLRSGKTELTAGAQRLDIDVRQLPAGTYFFSGMLKEGRIAKIIVKQ
ncbi:MAG: DUF1565 domain-containing protein [Bacteroidota bacterium]